MDLEKGVKHNDGQANLLNMPASTKDNIVTHTFLEARGGLVG
jgi:hypothetical protein